MKVARKHQLVICIARNVVRVLMVGSLLLFPVTINAEIRSTHHDFAYSGLSDEYAASCQYYGSAVTTLEPSS